MIDVITCRGTGEPQGSPNNMLTQVTRQLDPRRYRVLGDVVYPASVGVANEGFRINGPSEADSIRIGIANLATMIRSTPNMVVLLGYSLGAELVTKFSEAQARGLYSDCEIAATACVANPQRRAGDSIDPVPAGFGINGERGVFPDRPHFEAANPRDAITSCAPGSPLRALADVMSAFGLAMIGAWSKDLLNRMLQRRWQPAGWGDIMHPVKTWEMYQQAADDVRGYLTGQHTTAYSQGGYLDRLAVALNNVGG
ncbi:PE-PPE domain-containing protein [Nocardia miyunensis]|uniref:PE-PPE domain-containing protein n=1 Tax=Nocardia miyunensis TaxID=282684 RepID=UPI00082E8E78|nr:PE-PPE domain-containing protein [Nocardia miyunensis]